MAGDRRHGLRGLRSRPRRAHGSAPDPEERPAPADAPAERVDRAGARLFGVSRGRAREWSADGRVRIDGKRVPKGAPARPGTRISVQMPPPDQPAPQPELPVRIVHADAHVVVADKPAGMPSHPLKPREKGTAANAPVGRFPELASLRPPPPPARLAPPAPPSPAA